MPPTSQPEVSWPAVGQLSSHVAALLLCGQPLCCTRTLRPAVSPHLLAVGLLAVGLLAACAGPWLRSARMLTVSPAPSFLPASPSLPPASPSRGSAFRQPPPSSSRQPRRSTSGQPRRSLSLRPPLFLLPASTFHLRPAPSLPLAPLSPSGQSRRSPSGQPLPFFSQPRRSAQPELSANERSRKNRTPAAEKPIELLTSKRACFFIDQV